MGVPGEGELVAVGVEKLKDAGLGRVEEGEAEVGVAVGGTGDGGVVVRGCGGGRRHLRRRCVLALL